MTFDGSKKERDADSAQAAYTTVATPPVPRTEGFKELNKLFVMYKIRKKVLTSIKFCVCLGLKRAELFLSET